MNSSNSVKGMNKGQTKRKIMFEEDSYVDGQEMKDEQEVARRYRIDKEVDIEDNDTVASSQDLDKIKFKNKGELNEVDGTRITYKSEKFQQFNMGLYDYDEEDERIYGQVLRRERILFVLIPDRISHYVDEKNKTDQPLTDIEFLTVINAMMILKDEINVEENQITQKLIDSLEWKIRKMLKQVKRLVTGKTSQVDEHLLKAYKQAIDLQLLYKIEQLDDGEQEEIPVQGIRRQESELEQQDNQLKKDEQAELKHKIKRQEVNNQEQEQAEKERIIEQMKKENLDIDVSKTLDNLETENQDQMDKTEKQKQNLKNQMEKQLNQLLDNQINNDFKKTSHRNKINIKNKNKLTTILIKINQTINMINKILLMKLNSIN